METNRFSFLSKHFPAYEIKFSRERNRDLAEIINADSYDAKVNKNINVTGLDGVNVVVSDKNQ